MVPLFKHQADGVFFLREKKKAILADEMGLGKTRQAIVAAGQEEATGILVICPASLKINWEREIKMVYPEDEVYVVESGPEESMARVPWVIINYDMIGKYKRQILDLVAEGKIDTVIIDEAHYIKGSSTIRAKDTLTIVENVDRVYILTGTPILNRPVEMFNMLKAIKHPLGKIRTSFVRRYCGGQQKVMIMDQQTRKRFFVTPDKYYNFAPPRYRRFFFTDEDGATHLDELKDLTKDTILRRTKAESLDLPEKIISHLELDLTPEWQRIYDTAWETYISWIERHPDASRDVENIKNAQQLVEIGKLKQVCSLAKVSRITSDIENAIEQGEKVIVFSQYTKTILAIKEKVGGIIDPIECVTLTGDDDTNSRQKAVDSFQDQNGAKVFIANIKAGGVGINLTAGTIVMFADMDWSPGINRQAEDRAHRIGQKGTVNIYYYVCRETIEEEIIKIIEEKSHIISKIIGENELSPSEPLTLNTNDI